MLMDIFDTQKLFELYFIVPAIATSIVSILLFAYFFPFTSKSASSTSRSKSSFLQKILSPKREQTKTDEIIATTHSEYNDTIYSDHMHGPSTGLSHGHASHVIIEPPEKKWLLQSRVANARSPNDFFSIFDEFDILHKLKLPVQRLHSDVIQLTEQTFRDLVRDKININDELVRVDDAVARSPELFQSYFHNRIKEAISDHLSDLQKIDTLALYICCHLSRTRAGGDTLFAVKDIFDSPQLVITASHTDTHPPTDLHVTEDGWAYITTTSNFDVYLQDHLQDSSDHDHTSPSPNPLSHPLPLVTLSATLHEAIVIADKRSESLLPRSTQTPYLSFSSSSPSPSSSTKTWVDLPLPFYRKMSIVCFDPANPSSSFHGGWTAPVEPHYENDVSHLNWDHESVGGTSTDGIVCISSSMSGAAQLCLPVSRSKPITPSINFNPMIIAMEPNSDNGSNVSHMEALPTLSTQPHAQVQGIELNGDNSKTGSSSCISHVDSMEFSTSLHYNHTSPSPSSPSRASAVGNLFAESE